MKKILMIAYHFPPLAGSSGIQRTLRFVQHLPSHGWQPLVLTASRFAYEKTSDDLLADVPAGTVVRRAFALDTARHLQLGGRYLGWMARPDRWVSWKFDAIRQGLELIEEFKPDVIWSTFPIATAHLIASALHAKTGTPWIADFRDPMAQEHVPVGKVSPRRFPSDPRTWQYYKDIEEDAVAHAAYSVFTTPGAAHLYRQRYPAANGIVVLENGYDEESFVDAGSQAHTARHPAAGKETMMVMLHSGIVYPGERNPSQLFAALAQLRQTGELTASDLRIRFRAPLHADSLQGLARQHGVQDMIEVCPNISYREALTEMMEVDALLVLQSSGCNAQIPAKLYEYLRAGKPILGLTDPQGDTAGVLKQAGLSDIARLDSADEIAHVLSKFVKSWRQNALTLPAGPVVQQASRLERTKSLVTLLEQAATTSRMARKRL